jgi:hypothetical protein
MIGDATPPDLGEDLTRNGARPKRVATVAGRAREAASPTHTVSGLVTQARLVPSATLGLDAGYRVCVLTLAVELVDVPAAGAYLGFGPGDSLEIHTYQTDLTLLVGGRLTATLASGDRVSTERLWLVDILSAARAS